MLDLGLLSFLAEPWFVVPWALSGLFLALATAAHRRHAGERWDGSRASLVFTSVLGYAADRLRRSGPSSAGTTPAGPELPWMFVSWFATSAAGFSTWPSVWLAAAAGLVGGIAGRAATAWFAGERGRPAATRVVRSAAVATGATTLALGAVAGWVLPSVVPASPAPDTWAFWGFTALGLGLGSALAHLAHPLASMPAPRARLVPLAATTALALLAAITSWPRASSATEPGPGDDLVIGGGFVRSAPIGRVAEEVARGAHVARLALLAGERTLAVRTLDATARVADVAREGTTGRGAEIHSLVADGLRHARRAIQRGDPDRALRMLEAVEQVAGRAGGQAVPPEHPEEWVGATVLDARGRPIAEVTAADAAYLTLAAGSAVRDVLGFVDVGGQLLTIPAEGVVYGSHRGWGHGTFVVLPEALERRALVERSLTTDT